MNRGAFQQDKMPDETEEDYLARLQANAEEEYTDETLFEADMDIKRKFKEALKKLIRDDIKIEQVANSIRTNEIEIKNNTGLTLCPQKERFSLMLKGRKRSMASASGCKLKMVAML